MIYQILRVIFFILILEFIAQKAFYDPEVKELIIVLWVELKSNPLFQLMVVVFLLGIGLIVDIVIGLKKKSELSGMFFLNLIIDFPRSIMYVLLFPFVMIVITVYFGIKMLWTMGRSFWIFLIKRVLGPFFQFLIEKIVCPLFKFIWHKVIHPLFSFVWNYIIKPVKQFLNFCWDKFVSYLEFLIVKIIYPILTFIWNKILYPFFMFVWNYIIKPILRFFKFCKDKFVSPVADLFRKGIAFIYNRSSHLISKFFKNVVTPALLFILKWITIFLIYIGKVIYFFFRCLWEVFVFVYKLLRPIFMFVWNYGVFPVWKYVLVPVSVPIWRLFVVLWDSIVAPLAHMFVKVFDAITSFVGSFFV